MTEATLYALSVKQPWAELIARGDKRVEYRSWTTRHRGDLLIVASKSPDEDGFADNPDVDEAAVAYGAAVCVVELRNVTGRDGAYEWHVANPRRVEPFPLRGYAALYTVPEALIVYAATPARRAKPRATTTKRPRHATGIPALLGGPPARAHSSSALIPAPPVTGKLSSSGLVPGAERTTLHESVHAGVSLEDGAEVVGPGTCLRERAVAGDGRSRLDAGAVGPSSDYSPRDAEETAPRR